MLLAMALSRRVLLCLSALVLFSSQAAATAVSCTVQFNPSRCVLADGSNRYIDLSNQVFQSFPSNDGQYTYAFDPSGKYLNKGGTCTPGNRAAACEHVGDEWYTLGLASQVTVFVESTSPGTTSTWTYRGGDSGREVVVVVSCGPGLPEEITDDGEHPQLIYNFALFTKDGCLKNPGPPPKKGTTCGVTGFNNSTQCELPDDRFLDISSLAHTFANVLGRDDDYYTYAPMGDMGGPCAGAAMCQFSRGSFYSLGDASHSNVTVDFTENPVVSTWTYFDGNSGRTTIVTIVCAPHLSPGKFTYEGENPAITYNFVIESVAGCIRSTA